MESVNIKSTFETLDVWKESRELRKKNFELIKTFPFDEEHKLIERMTIVSRAITSDIAQGYGRYHYKENIQFCRQSRGSLYELLDNFTVALDENYISEETFEEFKSDIFKIIKNINGYIDYLKKRKTEKLLSSRRYNQNNRLED